MEEKPIGSRAMIFKTGFLLLGLSYLFSSDFVLSPLRATAPVSIFGPVHDSFELRIQKIFSNRLKPISGQEIPPLTHYFLDLCKTYTVDPILALSVIHIESQFKTNAVSEAGAVGLMQIMPATALDLIKTTPYLKKTLSGTSTISALLMDPYVNLTLGISYLSQLMDRYPGLSPRPYLSAYYVGPGKTDFLLQKFSGEKPGSIPATQATEDAWCKKDIRRYSDAVLQTMEDYRNRYFNDLPEL